MAIECALKLKMSAANQTKTVISDAEPMVFGQIWLEKNLITQAKKLFATKEGDGLDNLIHMSIKTIFHAVPLKIST